MARGHVGNGLSASGQRRVAGVGLLVCAGLGAARAFAEENGKLTLEWTAPAGCPGESELRSGAERLLGGPIEPHLQRDLVVKGRVGVAGERLVLDLETIDGGIRGQRTLSGATCEELTSAAALIVALAVDPKAVAAHSVEGGEPAPASAETGAMGAPPAGTSSPAANPAPPAVAVQPPQPTAPQPPREPPRGRSSPIRITARAEASLVGDWGTLPGPTLGPELAAVIGLDRFRVRPFAAYYLPRFGVAPGADPAGSGGDVSLLVGGLAGCYAVLVGSPELDGCVAIEGGALFAVGRGFDHPRDAAPPWLAAGGDVDLVLPIAGPLSLRASIGAMLPFGHSHIRFSQDTGKGVVTTDIHHPALVSGRAAIGIAVRF